MCVGQAWRQPPQRSTAVCNACESVPARDWMDGPGKNLAGTLFFGLCYGVDYALKSALIQPKARGNNLEFFVDPLAES